MRIICAEKIFGRGCDVVIIENNIAYLIQVKECKLDNTKAKRAIEQINITENDLKKELSSKGMRIEKLRFIKIYLHDKRRGCKTITQAQLFLRSKKVKVITSNSYQGKKFYDLYKRYCPD